MTRYLQCAEQQESASNFSNYCACHAKWLSWSIRDTPETLFTMRGTTGGILQHHQILRLPRKMTVMTDPRHIWHVIYNAQNNRWHPPTSPNTAPATQIDAWNFHQNFSKTAEMSFPMRGRSENDPSRIREWSENDPRMIRLLFALATSIFYWKIQHFALRLSFQISPNTAPATKNDCHDTVMTDPRHIWNAIYNARNNRWHPPTSPNTAPATQNDCHDWSSSHMKRYLQCAEQQVASSNITKYCACHAKWFSKISETFLQNRWNVNYNARPIREWFELDPSWKPSSATRLATEVTFQDHHEHFVLKNTTFRAPAIIPNFTEYCACHEKWHFNFTEYCACHAKWLASLILITCHTSFTMRSATALTLRPHYTAPATQNETHDWSAWHMKRYLQCAEQQVASSNITKYCACHAKWFSKISETFLQNRWNVNYNARPIREWFELDPSWKPSSATRLATEVTFQDHHEHFVLKNTTFRAPAIIPNFTEYCACHEKWHFNFTEYCACHAKWLASLILITCHTSFTMRSATALSLRPH